MPCREIKTSALNLIGQVGRGIISISLRRSIISGTWRPGRYEYNRDRTSVLWDSVSFYIDEGYEKVDARRRNTRHVSAEKDVMCEILTNYFGEESGEVYDLLKRLQVAAAHAIMYTDGYSANAACDWVLYAHR